MTPEFYNERIAGEAQRLHEGGGRHAANLAEAPHGARRYCLAPCCFSTVYAPSMGKIHSSNVIKHHDRSFFR